MCFYDQYRFDCGDWKFGNFREHCQSEYRMGETCGMKLVFKTVRQPEDCWICVRIAKKSRKRDDRKNKISRWQAEGDKPASIEKARAELVELEADIRKHVEMKNRAKNAVGTRG